MKNERRLQRIDRIFHKVTTTDDPIIRKVSCIMLSDKLHANNILISNCQLAKTEGNVYATDSILATLMCSIRSNYSWDIIVQKVGGKLFFDKRDDSEFGTYFYYLFSYLLLPFEYYFKLQICSLFLKHQMSLLKKKASIALVTLRWRQHLLITIYRNKSWRWYANLFFLNLISWFHVFVMF